ncbi:MAG: MBG domain-containing protein, partial [Opitutales bacterium]
MAATSLSTGLALHAAPPLSPEALPGGGEVAAGNAAITVEGSQMEIDQHSDRAILNWQDFDIGRDAAVNFDQPGLDSVALNRVLGGDPSQIFGDLSANGQVFLINPSGVIFGQGSRVDTGGLVASTMSLSDEDFLAGDFDFFSNGSSAEVLNQGLLNSDGGYVGLFGERVLNEGVIRANFGTVALASGDAITLGLEGNQVLSVAVDGKALSTLAASREIGRDAQGRVLLTETASKSLTDAVVPVPSTAANQLVENADGSISLVASTGSIEGETIAIDAAEGAAYVAGALDASSADSTGGQISVLGDTVRLDAGAAIDASGATGGGQVLIGGDFQGKNPTIRNATRTAVHSEAELTADARITGDGGEVIVWADDFTDYRGTISARGGAESGDGGFVEVSGKEHLSFRGRVDAGADHGAAGTLLLDPKNINIADDGTDSASETDNEFADSPASDVTIAPSDILAIIGSGSNTDLTLQANNDIDISDAIISDGSGILTFEAGRSILVDGTIDTNNRDIHFNFNNASADSANRDAGVASFTNNTLINAGIADVYIQADDTATSDAVNVDTGIINAQDLSITHAEIDQGGTITLGGITINGDATIDASTGPVDILNVTTDGSIRVLGQTNITTAGDVDIQGANTDLEELGVIANDVTIFDKKALQIGTSSISSVVSGDLKLDIVGAIGNTGPVTVDGVTYLKTTDGGFGIADPSISLTDSSNDFNQIVVDQAEGGDSASFTDANDLIIGGTFADDLTITTSGNMRDLTQTEMDSTIPDPVFSSGHTLDVSAVAPLTFRTTGNFTTLNAGAAGNITFDHASNDFDSMRVNNANDVELVDTDNLRLYGSTTQGNYTLDAGGDVELDSGDTFNIGGSLDIQNTSGFIEVENYVNLNVTDDLILTSDAGDVDFRYDADAVVDGSMTVDAAGEVYFERYSDIDVNATNGTGDLSVTAGGDIYQYQGYDTTGSLTIEGASTFTVTAADSDLLLQQAGNNFIGTVTMSSSGAGSYQDVDFRNTFGGGPAVLSGLESAGQMRNVTLFFDNAPSLELPGMDLTGDLTVDVPNGLITQADEILVAGDAEFDIDSALDITLDDPDNDFNDILFEQANDVTLVDTDGFNFHSYYDGSHRYTDINGDLSVTAGGDVTQTNTAFGIRVDGLSQFTMGSNNLTLDYDLYNQFNQIQIVSANNVDISTTTNVELLTSTIDGTFELDSDGGDDLTQAASSVITTAGNTIFRDFSDITLDETGNVLGALQVSTGYSGTTRIREDDAITQSTSWGTSSQTVNLTTSDDQAITLDQAGNVFGNLGITQINDGNATPGAVLIRENSTVTQSGDWTTHGDTHIDAGVNAVELTRSGNVLAPLKIEGGTTDVYENDTIEDYDDWSTSTTDLRAYAGGILGDGDIILDSTGNVLGNLDVDAHNVTIIEDDHITDASDWDASGDVVLNPGTSGSYEIDLDDTDHVLGPIDIDGTPSQVTLYESDPITQAGAWDIGAAPIILNSGTHAISLTETGNVLGAIQILTSSGTPASVTITEDDAITQGGTWALPGKPVTLATENEQAITLDDAANDFGDLTLTGGAVSIREVSSITDGSAWTTTGTTTLNPGTSGSESIVLDEAGNVLGDLSIAGSPQSVSIIENDDITQASAWIHELVPFTLEVADDFDILLSEATNQLGDLKLTAGGADGDVTLTEASPISDASAWSIGGTASLTAKDGATLQDIVLDSAGPIGTIANLRIVEAADVSAHLDLDTLQVDAATNVSLEDPNAVDLNSSSVTDLFKIDADGHITQTGGALSTVDLLLVGSGYATLEDAGNDVDNLAAAFTGGSLSYTDSDDFAVSTIDGTVGIGINDNDVTLKSDTGTISSLTNISSLSTSLSIETGTGLSLPDMIIAGSQDYTAGGTGITLNQNIQSTAAGSIQFNSPVAIANDLSVQSTDSPVVFSDTVDGGSNILTVNAGMGTITFQEAVSGIGDAGDASAGLNLTAGGTGSTFESTLTTNNGITATGPVVFRDDVTLGDGTAGSVFGGQVTLGKVGGMDLSGFDTLRFSGGVLFENGPATINSNNSQLTFEGANTVSGPFGLTLDSGTAEIAGLEQLGTNITSLSVTADEIVVPASGISIAGPQDYNPSGGTDITLDGDVTSTAAGAIDFNGPVTMGAAATVSALDSNITFSSTLGGSHNLTVDAGSGTTAFDGKVGQLNGLGDAVGAALTLDSTGVTNFADTVETNSGIVAAGPLTFAADVTLDDGDTASTFSGRVTTGGNTISGFDGLNFDGGLSMTGNTVLVSNGADTSFGDTVDGTFELDINALTGAAGTVMGLGQIDGELTRLSILAHGLSLPDGLAISGPMDFTADNGITLNGDLGSAAAPATGQIDLFSPVTLAANSEVRTADADIFFHDTIDGAFNLTLNPGTGTVSLDGAVGENAELNALDVAGTVNLNAGAVTTTDFQNYGDTTLEAATILDGANVSFTGSLDGGYDLTIDASGDTRFEGLVGAGTVLASITTDAPGTTVFDTSSITTSGAQDYGDAVTLGPDVSVSGAGVAFRSTIDGAQDLSVDAGSGTARFADVVGGSTGLTLLEVTGDAIEIAADLTTDPGSDPATDPGHMSFTGPITLESDVTLSTGATEGGDISFSGATSTINGAQALVLEVGDGDVTIGGLVGGITPLSSIDVSGNDLFLHRIETDPIDAQTYDALNNITLTESRTLNGPIAFTADSDNSGAGSFILEDGVSLTASNNSIDITAADLDLQGSSTLTSGNGLITLLATADGGIGLADGAGQMTISGDELSRMTSSGGLTLATTGAGDIRADNVAAIDSQNISGPTTLDAQGTGDVVIEGGASAFNAVTLDAAGGTVQLDTDLSTSGDEVIFATPTTVSSTATVDSAGGDISFADTLTVDNPLNLTTANGEASFNNTVNGTSTLTLNLDAGSVSGLDQLDSTLTALTVNATSPISLPAITINGPMDFNTGVVTASGNLTGTGLSFADDVEVASDGLEFNSRTGTLDFQAELNAAANDLTLTGDEINFADSTSGTAALLLRPFTNTLNVALGGAASTAGLDLGTSDLAHLIADWSMLTLGRTDGSGGLEFADDVDLATVPVTLNGAGGITQPGGGLTGTGDLTLWTSGAAINLDDAGNSLGAIDVTGTPTDVTIVEADAITQQAGGWSLDTVPVDLDAGSNAITLTDTANEFGTLTLVGSDADLYENAATDLGASTLDTLDLTSTGAVTTSGTVAVSGEATLRTNNDAGAGITIADASTFGRINALALESDDGTLAAGDISLTFGDSLTLGEIQNAANTTLSATGTHTLATDAASTLTTQGLELLGAAVTHDLRLGSVDVATLAGDTDTVRISDADGFSLGTVNSTGLTASGLVDLDTTGTINQTEALAAAQLLLQGTGGSYTLNNSGNAITTLAADTGTLRFTENSGYGIGSVDTVDGITLTGSVGLASTGTVTQTQAISAPSLDLSGAGGTFELASVDNAIDVLAGNTGTVTLRDDDGFSIGSVDATGLTTSGNTVLQSTGTVTQTELLSAAGLALSGAGATYTLENAANTVGTLAADTGDLSFNNDAAILIGSVNPDGVTTTGDFSLTANGAITQTEAMDIGGNLSLTTTHNAGDVELTEIVSATTTLGETSIGGDYTLTATGNAVDQTTGASLQVAGDLTVDAASVTLGNEGNFVGGTTSSGTTSVVRQAGVITLGDVTEGGDYTVISEATSKTAGAAVHGEAITLNNVGNQVGGDIAITTEGPTVTEGSEVQTGINQSAGTTLDITGKATFIAENSSVADSGVIDLSNSGNSFGSLVMEGTTITVVEDTGASVIDSVAADSLDLTSAGAVTQTGAILVDDLQVESTGGFVTLQDENNAVTSLAGSATGGFSFTDQDDVLIAALSRLTGIDAGGAIAVEAGTLVEVDNLIQIVSNGGDIDLSGEQIKIGPQATIDAGDTAGGGSITITGSGAAGNGIGIELLSGNGAGETTSILTDGSGTITLSGTGGSTSSTSNSGINIDHGSVGSGDGSVEITSEDGAITLTGTGGVWDAGTGEESTQIPGIRVAASSVSTSGNGAISIIGTGTTSATSELGDRDGVVLEDGTRLDTSAGSGAITIDGTAYGTGEGVDFNDTDDIEIIAGTGGVDITGLVDGDGAGIDGVGIVNAIGGSIEMDGQGGDSGGDGIYLEDIMIGSNDTLGIVITGSARGGSGDEDGVSIDSSSLTAQNAIEVTGVALGSGEGVEFNDEGPSSADSFVTAGEVTISGTSEEADAVYFDDTFIVAETGAILIEGSADPADSFDGVDFSDSILAAATDLTVKGVGMARATGADNGVEIDNTQLLAQEVISIAGDGSDDGINIAGSSRFGGGTYSGVSYDADSVTFDGLGADTGINFESTGSSHLVQADTIVLIGTADTAGGEGIRMTDTNLTADVDAITLTGAGIADAADGHDIVFEDAVSLDAATDVTLTGDFMDLFLSGSTAPSVTGSGVLTIQARDDGDSDPSFASLLDTKAVDFGTAFTSAQIGRTGNTADVTLGSGGLSVDGPVTVNGGAVTLTGDLASTAAAATITLNAADDLALGNVSANDGAVDLNAVSGSITQSGNLNGVSTLTVEAGGSATLAGANELATLGAVTTGTGFELEDSTGGLLIDGDLATNSGDIQVHTEGGDLTLADGRSIEVNGTGDVHLAAGAGYDFENQSTAPAAPITLGDGRYLIYSHDHTTDLGNLAASPYMGRTWAANPPSTIGGSDDRAIFATQATLTFTADDQTRDYGDANPSFTHTVAGYIGDDDASVAFTGDPSLTTTATPSSAVGDYTISITQNDLASDKGYLFAFVDGELSINQALLSVTADDLSKFYGDADPALTFNTSGLKLGQSADDVLTGDLTREAGESVAGGPYAINQGTLALSNANYSLDFTGGTFAIDPRVISLSGARAYDGTSDLAAGVFSLNNLS